MKLPRQLSGFTLIELLIVVAIIGILAAIAIPNFLQAQVRAKVARAQADMRSQATALQMFQVDRPKRVFNAPPKASLPMDGSWWGGYCGPSFNDPCGPGVQLRMPLFELTTPIEYLASVPWNPFFDQTYRLNFPDAKEQPYRYFSENWKEVVTQTVTRPATNKVYAVVSSGPDNINSLGEYLIFGEDHLNLQPSFYGITTPGCLYDPTNGTVSWGDIVIVGP